VDKSFEGLLLSIFIHILLLVILWNAKLPHLDFDHDKTEVTFVEKKPNARVKSKAFVTETEKRETPETLDQEADFLSQFTKRVKKQLRAQLNGPTVNAQPKPQPAQQQERPQPNRVAGLRPSPPDEGVGVPGGATNQAIHTVAIGQSSIAEYIPGVEEGAFTALNTDQFTYYAFFARMNEQVRNRWVANVRDYMAHLTARDQDFLSKQERHTLVEIVLSPEGNFSTSILQQTSGDHALDQTAVEAFHAAAPFPNPPRGMIEPDGFIHLRYGFVVTFRPPSFSPASTQ
jgi:TonB family protein